MLTVPFPNVVENCLAGWSEEVKPIREKSLLWSKIWHEVGCPSTGVLFQLKKHAKARYKYAVRRLRRKQDQLRSRKMAEVFVGDNSRGLQCSEQAGLVQLITSVGIKIR